MENLSAKIDGLDPALAAKVREIIEKQWGKRLEEIKDLSIEQLYERIVQCNRISYRPVNRYILQAKFPTARDPYSMLFSLTA